MSSHADEKKFSKLGNSLQKLTPEYLEKLETELEKNNQCYCSLFLLYEKLQEKKLEKTEREQYFSVENLKNYIFDCKKLRAYLQTLDTDIIHLKTFLISPDLQKHHLKIRNLLQKSSDFQSLLRNSDSQSPLRNLDQIQAALLIEWEKHSKTPTRPVPKANLPRHSSFMGKLVIALDADADSDDELIILDSRRSSFGS